MLMTKFIFIFALLLLPCALVAKVYFHSDFEMGKTCNENEVEPGQRTIELVPNHHLEEWPLNKGRGIIEGNLPAKSETFTYDKRADNKLKGVQGIKYQHAKWVDMRFGNMSEWDVIEGSIITDGQKPIHGNSSAKIIANSRTYDEINKEIPENLTDFYIRFYVCFSEDLLDSIRSDTPLRFMRVWYRKYRLQYVALLKTKNGFSLCLFRTFKNEKGKSEIVNDKSMEIICNKEIFPMQKYSIEYHFREMSDSTGKLELWLDGLPQGAVISEHSPWREENINKLFFIKSCNQQGAYYIDDVEISDAYAGTIPEKPKNIFLPEKDRLILRSSGFIDERPKNRRVSSQWQIGEQNSWINLMYDSGEDFEHLDSIDVSDYLTTSNKYYWRLRHKNDNGSWSDWSEPTTFVHSMKTAHNISSVAPRVLDIKITDINKTKRLSDIQRDIWYDVYIYLQDPQGWSNIRYADLWLSSQSYTLGNIQNRGGDFNLENNYLVSYSIISNKIWAIGKTGHHNITGKLGLYVDDDNGEYEQNSGQGWAKARIKLLPEANPGIWTINAYVIDKVTNHSAIYRGLVHITPSSNIKKDGMFFVCFLGGILLLIAFIAYSYKKWKKKAHLQNEKNLNSLVIFSKHDNNIRKALDFIENHYKEDISLKQVAEFANVSPAWLSKIFSDGTNMTIVEYIIRLRIDESKKLLKNSTLNISEIAYNVGFQDQAYFHRIFKKMEKMTPKEYRRGQA